MKKQAFFFSEVVCQQMKLTEFYIQKALRLVIIIPHQKHTMTLQHSRTEWAPDGRLVPHSCSFQCNTAIILNNIKTIFFLFSSASLSYQSHTTYLDPPLCFTNLQVHLDKGHQVCQKAKHLMDGKAVFSASQQTSHIPGHMVFCTHSDQITLCIAQTNASEATCCRCMF